MNWRPSHRFDSDVVPIADRHYNRQKIGSPQFVPPGRCVVLKIGSRAELRTPNAGGAFWITSWPFAEYVKHAWAGAWVCSAFRNEGAGKSSELIREAIALTRGVWEPPPLGMITFVDPDKIRPRERNWGKCYRRAGFRPAICSKHMVAVNDCAACASKTKDGLIALQMLPVAMPEPITIESPQRQLFGRVA